MFFEWYVWILCQWQRLWNALHGNFFIYSVALCKCRMQLSLHSFVAYSFAMHVNCTYVCTNICLLVRTIFETEGKTKNSLLLLMQMRVCMYYKRNCAQETDVLDNETNEATRIESWKLKETELYTFIHIYWKQ